LELPMKTNTVKRPATSIHLPTPSKHASMWNAMNARRAELHKDSK